MNSRIAHIASMLAEGGEALPLDQLAHLLGISQRLVRYELDGLDAFLARSGLSPVLRHRSGVGFSSSDEAKRALAAIDALRPADFALSPEERRDVELVLFAFKGADHLTSQDIADELEVSRSIIDRDIALLRTELTPLGLSLVSLSGKGRRLMGDEMAIRNLVVQLIERNVDFSYVHEPTTFVWGAVSRWLDWLGVIRAARSALRTVMDSDSVTLSRCLAFDSLRMVIYTIATIVLRIHGGHRVSAVPPDLASVVSSREYVYAVQVSEALAEKGDVVLPEEEVASLAVTLMGMRYVMPEPYLREDWISIQLLLDRLVKSMEHRLGIAFSTDRELIDSLQNHLGPMSFRLRHGITTPVPDVTDARTLHPACFSALAQVIDDESDSLLSKMSEGDVAYVALYFCASVERLSRRVGTCRVGFVSARGTAAATLLGERVSARLPTVRVASAVSAVEVLGAGPHDLDLIVSDVPLSSGTAPRVVVSPELEARDWERLERVVGTCCGEPSSRLASDDLFLESIMGVVGRYCEILDVDGLLGGLGETLAAHGIIVRTERAQPSLAELLRGDRVRCGEHADGWEEAIRVSCAPLVTAGDVDEAFVETAIEDARRQGPFFVFSPGVALVHGQAGRNVRRLAMSLTTFPEGVRFGHPDNDPVYVVFCLAATDNWSHVRALRDLLELCERVDSATLGLAQDATDVFRKMKGA